MFKKKVKIGHRVIGEGHPTYVIAEAGLSNWGSLSLAKKQVDAAMAAGVDAIKFQSQSTDELVSKRVDPYWYRRLKYKELSYKELAKLWEYCDIRNIDCFITPHTEKDIEFLDKELDVPCFKIGSGESINDDFVSNVCSRKKPVIISFGLHFNIQEINKTIKIIKKSGLKEVIIMHCLTKYPSPPDICDLQKIADLKKMFRCPVGYSDHSIGIHIPTASVALGACAVEKHLSFNKLDKRSFDNIGSCIPEDLITLVDNIRDIEKALEVNKLKRHQEIKKARLWASQSIVAKRNLKKGSRIEGDDIILKRPGLGLSSKYIKFVIGKKVRRQIKSDSLILKKDLI